MLAHKDDRAVVHPEFQRTMRSRRPDHRLIMA
jgi:hypothetical protein